MRIEYIDSKKTLNFGYCIVIEENNKFYGIYKNGNILTHYDKWKKATKAAKLLSEAYKEGEKRGYEEGYDDAY